MIMFGERDPVNMIAVEQCDSDQAGIDQDYVCIPWGIKGWGFGEFNFYMKDGKLTCDSECMSKEFAKRVLCAMIDNCEWD